MMKSNLIFVPGWNGSCSSHWQTLWQRELGGTRLEQLDWANPDPQGWVAALEAAVRTSNAPPILIAHSLGALTVILWAAQKTKLDIAGAFLVTPPDPEAWDAKAEIRRFEVSGSLGPLPFPALLVGSENDHYCTCAAARQMAAALHCNFWNAGAAGHINVASGHGPWPEGRARFDQFLSSQSESRAA